jgi:hypothetical protein
MTIEEEEMIASLERGPVALSEALHGVSVELALRSPSPGKWSILECVEHLALSEAYLFSGIQAAQVAASPLIDAEREARFKARGVDRSRRAESPQMVRPRGSFPTLADALQALQKDRQRTVQFVKDHAGEDLRSRVTSIPPFGSLNCHDVLLLMAAHMVRHAIQIEEIKAALA